MIPFVNRAFGISSFLGVLYFASYYNQTETPGVAKWFGGTQTQQQQSPSDSVPIGDKEFGVGKEEDGHRRNELDVYETLLVEQEEEPFVEKAFVAPLELIVLDKENIYNLNQGNWVIVPHLEFSPLSQSFVKSLMRFYEDLAARYNFDDLPITFAILDVERFPAAGLHLSINRVPSIRFIKAGRLGGRTHWDISGGDWRVLVRVLKKMVMHRVMASSPTSSNSSSGEKTKRRRSKERRKDRNWRKEWLEALAGKKPPFTTWFRILEYKLGIRFIRLYSHDQVRLVGWLQESYAKLATGFAGLGLISFLQYKL